MFCEPENIETNPLLEWVENVIFIIRGEFVLHIKDQDPVVYKDFPKMKKDFAEGRIHPLDLKESMIVVLNELLDPIRKKFSEPRLQKLVEDAYPSEKKGKAPKKEKGNDDKGAKATKQEKGNSDAAPTNAAMDPSRLDMRVGKIISVERHPDAEKLFVEKVDLGEASGPRTIISGLVGRVEQADLEGRLVSREVLAFDIHKFRS